MNEKWFDTPEGKASLRRANEVANAHIDEVTARIADMFKVAAADATGRTIEPDTDPVDDISSALK